MDLVTKLLGLAHDSGDQRNNSVSRLLNAKTGAGNAALHLAVSITMELRDHKKLVQMLLCRGADPSCKNAEGQLPREVARNQEVRGRKPMKVTGILKVSVKFTFNLKNSWVICYYQ